MSWEDLERLVDKRSLQCVKGMQGRERNELTDINETDPWEVAFSS